MDIILLLLIAQIIFYIVQDQHIYVFGFIGLSLLVQEYFSQKRMVYLLVPMAIIHILYCLNLKQNTGSIHEGFKGWKEGKKAYHSSKKTTAKGTVDTYNKSKKGIKKQKIMKKLKKFNEDLKVSTAALTKDMNFVSSSLNNLISQSKKEEKEEKETPTDTTSASANFNTDKYNETYDPNKDKATLP
jgi:predicted membrane protein